MYVITPYMQSGSQNDTDGFRSVKNKWRTGPICDKITYMVSGVYGGLYNKPVKEQV